MPTIPFSDFQKCEIKIGTIVGAERVPNSEKLVKLDVDFGSEKRQIVAGVGRVHAPESLLNAQCTFIVNLKPRMLMGLESQGMLLAASDSDGNPVLLRPEKPVGAGEVIH